MNRQSIILLLLMSALTIFVGAPVHTAHAQITPVRQRVIVRLNIDSVPEPLLSDTAVAAQRDAIQSAQALTSILLGPLYNADIRIRFQTQPYIVIEIDAAARARLNNSALVRQIVDDIPMPLLTVDAAPAATTTANTFIGAPEAWANGFDGRGQTVAIIDTGVDRTHPALDDNKVVFEGCFTDGDCTGRMDAIIGTGVAQPFGCENCDHGTHVAGITAGKDGDFSGVAPGANIAAMNAFSLFGEEGSSDGFYCGNSPRPCVLSYPSDQAVALEVIYLYRNDYNIVAINMSLGSNDTFSTACDMTLNSVFFDMINALYLVNIPIIAASGNGGDTSGISSPGCGTKVVSVGAVNNADVVINFSNSASILDLLAPGSSITSSVPGGGYDVKSGTSMAAPYVAGTWAIMRQTYPNLSLEDILLRFKRTGRLITDNRNGQTFPRIQVNALIREALGYPYIPPGLTNAFVTRRDFESVLLNHPAEGVMPLGVRFIGRQFEIAATYNNVEVAAMIRPWSEEGTVYFAVESQQRTDGKTLSSSTRQHINDALPNILVATFDSILESDCFAADFDTEIIYIDDLGLLRIYGTPDIACPPVQPNG